MRSLFPMFDWGMAKQFLASDAIRAFSAPLLCVVWMLGGSGALQAQEADVDPSRLFEPREYSDASGNVLRYRLLKPVGFEPTEQYPLVVFLHGAGERGGDNSAQLKHGMSDFCDPDRRSRFPCYVLAPQCPTEQRWADVDWNQDSVRLPGSISVNLRLVLEVVDRMLEDAAIDKSRIYITGLSMGGYGTWDALYRRPDLFAAAMPICGGGDPITADKIKHVPVWCFHGDADRVVRVEFSRDMVAALKEAGGSPRYTEYAGVGHNSWSQTYANAEVYEWLFSQRRKTKQANASEQ